MRYRGDPQTIVPSPNQSEEKVYADEKNVAAVVNEELHGFEQSLET
jgi:hypothetical protein